MSEIKIKNVSLTEERRIAIGLITSTEFTRRIENVLDLAYFTNKYLERIASWSLSYYDKYKKAPFKHIKDIYEKKAHKIKEVEAELIEDLLNDLSNQYDAEHVNVEYLLQCAEGYFRKRELEIVANNIKILNDEGKLDEAEKELKRYNKVSIELDKSIYINPGDPKQRNEIYRKREETEKEFFRLPGDMGLFLGNHKKGDVVAFTAPAKRGKSFLLGNYFNQAIMSQKKAVWFSVEMTDTETLTRSDKSFAPMLSEELRFEKGIYFYPVFDCVSNQDGSCKDRKSKVKVLKEDKMTLDEKKLDKHKPCTKCRDKENWRFRVTTWDKKTKRDVNNMFVVQKKMKPFLSLLNRYGRIVVRPKYSLTYDLMLHDLEQLESLHGFIPEIIILDYLDILKIVSRHDDHKLVDEKWQLAQELAGLTQCLVVTVTQGNKVSYESDLLKPTDQAGFYGKDKHVNLMGAINQTPFEKRRGIWRVSKLNARDLNVDQEDVCIVLQDIKTGQMHLDSYWKNKFMRKY